MSIQNGQPVDERDAEIDEGEQLLARAGLSGRRPPDSALAAFMMPGVWAWTFVVLNTAPNVSCLFSRRLPSGWDRRRAR